MHVKWSASLHPAGQVGEARDPKVADFFISEMEGDKVWSGAGKIPRSNTRNPHLCLCERQRLELYKR